MPFLIALVFVVADFGLHMSKHSDSMLNERNHVISNAFLTSQIQYHKELPPFARRPLTSWLIESTATTFGMRLGVAFIWVIYRDSTGNVTGSVLTPTKGSSYWLAIGNMVIYFLGFSILFAFFTPLFTYDEPLQYTMIFASLLSMYQRKWIL